MDFGMHIKKHTPPETKSQPLFLKEVASVGVFELRPFQIENDLPIIYQWIQQDYAVYWGMVGLTFEEVKNTYKKLITNSNIYTGYFNGQMAFLLECYNPSEDIIKEHYSVENGDCGMHILVAPPTKKINNFTWNIFQFILDFIFSDVSVERIVVEPDANNHKIHALNEKAGFELQRIIQLPHKTARLEFCTREQYKNALLKI